MMQNKIYTVIGLMSGTSLDGVDAAILRTDGERICGFGPVSTRAYSAAEHGLLHAATQDALVWDFKGAPPNSFAQAEALIHQTHLDAVDQLIKAAGVDASDIDLIGFHGQTVLHRPPKGGANGQTLQLGDGQVLADATGIDTVFDFRTHDMERGGQGAPLAPIFHQALVEKTDLAGVTAVLNIGGVSNVTMLKDGEILLASDCGPGNGPLDTWIEAQNLGRFDKDGKVSGQGTPDIALIDRWLSRKFFKAALPKSADRWDFDVLGDLDDLNAADGAATLAAFAAQAIGQSLKTGGYTVDNTIVCGGGRLNPIMMAALREQGLGRVMGAEDIGWQGDDIEAQAFAYLAVRSKLGLPLSVPQTTGVNTPVSGGKLAKPHKF